MAADWGEDQAAEGNAKNGCGRGVDISKLDGSKSLSDDLLVLRHNTFAKRTGEVVSRDFELPQLYSNYMVASEVTEIFFS